MTIWSAEIKELQSLFESVSGRFPGLEKELQKLIRADDENIVLVYSRRCLEVIITDLCECELGRPRKTEPLKGVIDKLNREEKVPSHIITSMLNLNSLSAYGAHPKDFDPEQVRPVLSNLTIIIKWYVKYKDTQAQGKQTEHVKEVTIDQGDSKDSAPGPKKRPRKRLIFLLSGLGFVIAVVVCALFLFDIIGGGRQIKELEKSIAVKPFYNLSADPSQEYMSIGLTDEIINHLFRIASFDEVRSLSSVMVYKDSDKTTPQIGRELKVNYVLEGTYKKIGDRVKVTAQLIVAETDNHIWFNEYERPYEEIMGIQAEIALQIAGHIDAFITSSERQNIEKIPTTNQEAYELVKQVVYLIELFTEGSLNLTADQVFEQGSDYCSRAIELDPSYADAYALAGLLFQARGWHIGLDEPTTVTPVAQHYYQKALELDPDNAQAHHGMSVINFFYNWDHIKAEEEYLKAVELQPNNQIFRMGLSEFYLKLDRPEEALLYADTSIKINILMGNPEKAYQALKLWSGSAGKENYKRIAENYLWLEEYDSARLYFEYARHFTDQLMLVPRFQACQALAYHQTNEPDLARNIINRLIAKANETSAGSPDYFTGWYYSGIQEVDSAFYWLDKAYISKSAEMTWLKVDPVFNNLKQNDRYWDLYERTGFKAYDDYLAGQQKRD